MTAVFWNCACGAPVSFVYSRYVTLGRDAIRGVCLACAGIVRDRDRSVRLMPVFPPPPEHATASDPPVDVP